MKKEEINALRGLISGRKIKKEDDFKESGAAKKQLAALMGGVQKKEHKEPPKVVVRQHIEKKLEKEEFPPKIKEGMKDVVGLCFRVEHGIQIKYFAVKLMDEKVRVSLSTPAGNPSSREIRDFTQEEFEQLFTLEKPEEKKESSPGSENVLGIYFKRVKGTIGSGSTTKESHLDIKYHATLLADGAVRIAMASPSGKPTKIDVQKFSREDFDQQFTPLAY